MKEILIVVGVLRRGNQVLIAQRSAGQHLAHFWEFPGGKVRPGETPEVALTREFEEEVGVTACDWQPLIERLKENELTPDNCPAPADTPSNTLNHP